MALWGCFPLGFAFSFPLPGCRTGQVGALPPHTPPDHHPPSTFCGKLLHVRALNFFSGHRVLNLGGPLAVGESVRDGLGRALGCFLRPSLGSGKEQPSFCGGKVPVRQLFGVPTPAPNRAVGRNGNVGDSWDARVPALAVGSPCPCPAACTPRGTWSAATRFFLPELTLPTKILPCGRAGSEAGAGGALGNSPPCGPFPFAVTRELSHGRGAAG